MTPTPPTITTTPNTYIRVHYADALLLVRALLLPTSRLLGPNLLPEQQEAAGAGQGAC